MALTNKLSAIGDAIREKTGKTDLMTLDEMPAEISAITTGGGGGEVEPIVLSDSCSYAFSNKAWQNLTTKPAYKNKISTNDITASNYMFNYYKLEEIPFELNYKQNYEVNMEFMYYRAEELKTLPRMNNCKPSSIKSMFEYAQKINNIPDDFFDSWDFTKLQTYAYAAAGKVFYQCRALRRIPQRYLNNMWGIWTSSSYASYPYNFQDCYALDEVVGVGVNTGNLSSNLFDGFLQRCYHLKRFTFDVNEDGTPKTANWKKQTIKLQYNNGYAEPSAANWMTSPDICNLPAEKRMIDDATYHLYKDDVESWTTDINYSRYNRTSAVETINSLPDCSAYIATQSGTGNENIIQFKGASGALTDGGAINTLTEEEIAVATAKGWTVSFV